MLLQPATPSSVLITLMNRVRGVVTGDGEGDELFLHAIAPKDLVEDERFRYRYTLGGGGAGGQQSRQSNESKERIHGSPSKR